MYLNEQKVSYIFFSLCHNGLVVPRNRDSCRVRTPLGEMAADLNIIYIKSKNN